MTVTFIMIGLIIGFILVVIITRPITVLFHELGHAIPAILLTRQKVTIYIGSYGDPANSIKVKIGLLEAWFKWNPFWKCGVCVPSASEVPVNKRLLYTVTGPLASLFMAFVGAYLIFRFDLHGSLKLAIVFFFGSAIFDLLVNIIPNEMPIKLYNGEVTYNDGYALKRLLWYKKFTAKYNNGLKHYLKGDYAGALSVFEAVLAQDLESEELYRLTIHSLLLTKQYEKALAIHNRLAEAYPLITEDYINAGLAKTYLEQHEEAMLDYERALEEASSNVYALNNKGYTLTILERYKEAIPLLDKAIEVDPEFAYAYNNRGYARMKIGNEEEGLQDIQYSLQLDPKNSYSYRNLGIYHLEHGDKAEALKQFIRARELDADTQMLKALIEEASYGKLHST